MAIDAATVRKVARLARIAEPEEKLEQLASELTGIMSWIFVLNSDQRLFGRFQLLRVVNPLGLKQRAFLPELRDAVMMCLDLGLENLLSTGDIRQSHLGPRHLSFHSRTRCQFRWPGRRCKQRLVLRGRQLTNLFAPIPFSARVRRIRGFKWRQDPGPGRLHGSGKLGKYNAVCL